MEHDNRRETLDATARAAEERGEALIRSRQIADLGNSFNEGHSGRFYRLRFFASTTLRSPGGFGGGSSSGFGRMALKLRHSRREREAVVHGFLTKSL